MKISGVKIATTNSGIKYQNRDDLLLVHFENGANVAGVFTKSTMASPSVNWCRKNLDAQNAKVLLVNSGNANTFTGKAGKEIIEQCAKASFANLNCNPSEFFMSSTGVIGEIFDYNLITKKIPDLVKNLDENSQKFIDAAKAITTTDLCHKIISKKCKIGDKEITITAIAKGSGMIQPNMATMLSYIFTDADIDSEILQKFLSEINEETFNSITIDSDTSTSDTVLLFATKAVKNDKSFDQLDDFKKTLREVMLDLAKKIVIDGEGATKLIEVEVGGAKNKNDAKKVALSIANSPLVKTAMAAADPNWGRIIMAIGKSEIATLPEKITLKIGDFIIAKNGQQDPNYNEESVYQYLKNDEVKIFVDLGLESLQPQNKAVIYTCDLTEEYIKINKDYRS